MTHKKLIYTTAATLMSLLPATLQAQSLFPFQQEEMAGNNPSLHATEGACGASVADAYTGLNLANPEVEVSYMFGSPSDVPNKTNISVTQGFDFATLSGAKRRVADAEAALIRSGVRGTRSQFAATAETALVNYIYRTQRLKELKRQLAQTDSLLTVASKALKAGTITILDYNSVEMSRLEAVTACDLAEVELQTAENDLTALNGGKPLSACPTAWPEAGLPLSFDEWIEAASAVNPELLQLTAQMHRASEEINLRKKEGLPEFSIGYTNELVKGSNYHGAAVGFSLPLWANSGRVKAAKANYASAQMQLQAAADSFRATKQSEYRTAQALLRYMKSSHETATAARDKRMEYLQLAFRKGSIDIVTYLTEQQAFNALELQHIDAIRDFFLARTTLYAPML